MLTTELYPLRIVCLPCYRQRVSMTASPPTAKVGGLLADCELCGRPTNYGIRIINREFLYLQKQWTTGEQEVTPSPPVTGVVQHENDAATQESPRPRESPCSYERETSDAVMQPPVPDIQPKAISLPGNTDEHGRMVLEMTVNPGWAYCPRCNTPSEWAADGPRCSKDGLCKGRTVLPIPTTKA